MSLERSSHGPPAPSLKRRRRARTAAVLLVLGAVAGLMVYAAIEADDQQRTGRVSAGGQPAVAQNLPCPKVDAPSSSSRTYDRRPNLRVTRGVDYKAVIVTSCGEIEIDLLERNAPRTVANFVWLAEDGFFDGLTWHRIERNFVIQTGDPDGINGHDPDGPGYSIPDELPKRDREYVYGVVAMVNEGPSTGGSQFFIVVHDPVDRTQPAGLESLYSIFGRVAESSYDTLDKISKMPVRGGNDFFSASRPVVAVYIDSVEILTDRR